MATPSPLAPGMVLANRFRLERLLGQGGMGSVWEAWHITLNVGVAIKFIDPQLVSSRDAWSRFSQEAMAAAKIKSPHVVNILDFGTDEAQRPYIAMELLQGEELASLLDREPTLPLPLVVRAVTQACKGLARAHAAGIVHRDIKPDNLFLSDDDDGFLLKILDFGIAKVASVGVSTHKTGTGQVLGTPLYMSPEQAYGNRAIDRRSDLYSLAVVAYRCLTGYVPFQSDGVGELIVAITTHEPPPPSRFRAGLPPGVDPWFRRALAKDPAQRFQSAKEMADAFAVACGVMPAAESTAQFSALSLADLNGPISGLISEPPASDAVPLVRRGQGAPPSSNKRQAVTLQGTTSSFLEPIHAVPSRRVWWAAGGVAAVALVAAGAVFWHLRSPPVVASAPRSSAGAPSAPSPAVPLASASPTEASPENSSPAISINSLPPDQPRSGPRALPGTNKAAPTKATATASGGKAPPAPATTTPAPPSTKTDYGI